MLENRYLVILWSPNLSDIWDCMYSLDAGSTFVQVSVKAGGLKLIQIQDNGCGIQVQVMHP